METDLLEGPCFLKMLVPNRIAGAVIGKEGQTIGEIELITRCQIRVSAAESYFPGTADRIVLASGSFSGVEECLMIVLRSSLSHHGL